jgi:hypothetical protein
MSNSISVQLNTTSRVDNVTSTLGSSVTAQLTSSNVIIQSVGVTNSGWTQLTLGSLTDVRNLFIWNDNTNLTGSYITIATGSSGGNPLTILAPGDGANIPWSGSFNGLYGRVVASSSLAGNGLIQYQATQS